jgi:hypothetical protein
MGDRSGAYRVLVGRPEEKDHLEDLYVDEDNIKMDFKDVKRRGMDWIDPVQNKGRYRALVNAVMSMRVP